MVNLITTDQKNALNQNKFGFYSEVWANEIDKIAETYQEFVDFESGTIGSTAFYDFTGAEPRLKHFKLGGSLSAGANGAVIMAPATDQTGTIDTTGTFTAIPFGFFGPIIMQQIIPDKTRTAGQVVRVWVLARGSTPSETIISPADVFLSASFHDDNGFDEPVTPLSVNIGKQGEMSSALGLFPVDETFTPKWVFWDVTLTSTMTAGQKYWFAVAQPTFAYVYVHFQTDQYTKGINTTDIPGGFIDSLVYHHQFGTEQTYVYEADLGSTPIEFPILTIDSNEPSGTSLSWVLQGGNSTFTDETLGTYQDGDILPYRLQKYRITVTFTSNTNQDETAVLFSAGISVGEKVFKFSSSSQINNSRQIIESVSPSKTKIDIPKMSVKSRTINMTVSATDYAKRLIYEKHNSSGARNRWKNSRVIIRIGPTGDSIDHWRMFPYFIGRLKDFSFEGTSLVLTIDDALADLAKAQIPGQKNELSSGDYEYFLPDDITRMTLNENMESISYIAENPVSIILDLIRNYTATENKLSPVDKIKTIHISISTFIAGRDAIHADWSRAFYRVAPTNICTGTVDASEEGTRTLTYAGLTVVIGTESDDFVNGCRVWMESGNSYKCADYIAASDDVVTQEPLATDDLATTRKMFITTWETRIKNQESIKKIIEDICQHIIAAVSVNEKGQITFHQYDSLGAPIRTWTDDVIVSIKSTYDTSEKMVNRCTVLHTWDGKGDGLKNFGRAQVDYDRTAALEWGENRDLIIKSKWFMAPESAFGGKTAAIRTATQWVNFLKNGVLVFDVTTLITAQTVDIEEGDYITIDSRHGWIKSEGRSSDDTIICWVTEKTWDEKSGLIKWSLIEQQ